MSRLSILQSVKQAQASKSLPTLPYPNATAAYPSIDETRHKKELPIVSIVVPFRGYLFRILNIELVKPNKRNYNGDYRYAALKGFEATKAKPGLGVQDVP